MSLHITYKLLPGIYLQDIYIAEVLLSSDMRFALIKNMPSSVSCMQIAIQQFLSNDIYKRNLK